jgi:hypothetical protein
VRARRAARAAAALAAAALAGCGGNSVMVGSAGAPPPVPPPPGLSASVSISISSTAANILAAGAVIGFLVVGNDVLPWSPAPPMREDRTVNEQDCTQPIANATANLKCR